MNKLEILLIATILIYPQVDLINEKYKSKNKIVEYIKIAIFLWVPTILLIFLYLNGLLSIGDFKFVVEYNWQNILMLSLLFIAIIYVFLLINSIRINKELREEIIKKFENYQDLMPVTRNETIVFSIIVSVSAGICEELLFRAYLYNLIEGHIGLLAAVLLSSVIFGLWHIYLGWKEVIRTGIMGIVLCGIYIFTGNIILPILIHIFVDVYSGLLNYNSLCNSHDESN